MTQGNTGVTEAWAPETGPASDAQPCPLREVLERISGKWSIQIIIAAASGPVRFTELERSIEGISRRMLTLTLRSLERDGLLSRTVYPTAPPKVEYSVTEPARELYESFLSLMHWAERHRQTIAEARSAYDRAASSRKESLSEVRWPVIEAPHVVGAGRPGRA